MARRNATANDFDPQVEYREHPRYPGYLIGSDGTVWTCWKRSRWWKRRDPENYVQLRQAATGFRELYRAANVVSSKKERQYVHRLVLETFVGPCPEGCEARHLDGNHSNNSLSNLVWGTHIENCEDRGRHGKNTVGMLSGTSRLKDEQVLEIRRLWATGEYRQLTLAERFGVGEKHIYQIVNRRRWKHI